jgi:hypothetical protein
MEARSSKAIGMGLAKTRAASGAKDERTREAEIAEQRAKLEAFHADLRQDPVHGALFKASAPPPPEVETLLEAAKFHVEFQIKVAERLDSKVRGLVGMTAAFVVGVQAFSLRSDVLNALNSPYSAGALIVSAALSAALVFFALYWSAKSVTLQETKEIEPELMMDLTIPAFEGDRVVDADLIQWHLELAQERKDANDERIGRIGLAQRLCLVALGAAAVEFIVAIASQL